VFGLSDADMRPLGLGELLPTTALFDRDGGRVFRLVGEVTKKRLVERLEWLLGDRAGRAPSELVLPPGIDRAIYDRATGDRAIDDRATHDRAIHDRAIDED